MIRENQQLDRQALRSVLAQQRGCMNGSNRFIMDVAYLVIRWQIIEIVLNFSTYKVLKTEFDARV